MTAFLKIIREIVNAAGVGDGFDNEPHFHLEVANPPYMDLVIESWPSPIEGEGRRISVAHYYEQNGDPVPDPEVEMRDDGWPIELSQAYMHTRVTFVDEDGTVKFYPRAKKEVMGFLDVWARNIREQDYAEAAKKNRGEA